MLRQINVITGVETEGAYTQKEIDARVVHIQTRDELRQAEAIKQGVTEQAKSDALWDRIMSGDNTASDALQAKLTQIKIDIS